MPANVVEVDYKGDSSDLTKASKNAAKATDDVAKASKDAGKEFENSSQKSAGFTDKIGKLGAGVSGMSDAIDKASGTLDAFNQIQNAGYERSQKQQRALVAVRQAQEDYNQAIRDSKQATLDAGQAQIDKTQADLNAAKALKQYNQDVHDHGKNSLEAAQDLIDLKQAQQDSKQATEDGNQALRDANQATIDAKNAQLDLSDAQREAHPPAFEKWSQQLQTYAPLLQGLIGIISLVTAAQWAWDAAMDANPIGLIIVGIGALIAGIVLLVKHWDWVKRVGAAAWEYIKYGAEKAWDFIKKIPGWIGSAFRSIGNSILAPFRWAFNLVSDAWNNTVGQLHWTVPGWVPGIGGNSIGVPHLPHFHSGGIVPGNPGQEVPIMALAGETVIPRGGSTNGEMTHIVVKIDRDTLLDVIAKGQRLRFG